MLSYFYGFTPEQIGKLTKCQVGAYMSKVDDLARISNPFMGKKKEAPPPPGERIDIVTAAGVESYGLW